MHTSPNILILEDYRQDWKIHDWFMNNNYKNYFESPLFMFFKKSLTEFHYIKLF